MSQPARARCPIIFNGRDLTERKAMFGELLIVTMVTFGVLSGVVLLERAAKRYRSSR